MPFPSPGDLPDPGIKPGSSALQVDSLPSESPGECVCEREREFVREIFREWGGANLLFEGGGQGMFI